MADITRRDVKRIKEAQDFAQRIAKEYEALRWRPGIGTAAQEKAKEVSEAGAVLDGCLESLNRQIERTEDVAL